MSRAEAPLIFLVAGEPSGDALGAPLMAALKRRTGGEIRFAGVGGPQMAAEGLSSLFPISDLAVMGIAEVLPNLRRILGRIRETADAVRDLRPAVVVTIDSPDFSVRVWRRIQGLGIPIIHYVAPSVWAWRAGRARKYARYIDHLLTLLPFEPPYFERVGLAATFVGHSALEGGAGKGDGPGFRRAHGIDADATVLCVLPGSRRGEIGHHLPVFRDTVARLSAGHAGLYTVLPTVPHLRDRIGEMTADWPTPLTVVAGTKEKYDAMAASDAALAASGTVALELALAGLPMVIAYRANPLTAAVAKALVKVDYGCLINLLLDRPAVPEMLQERVRPDILAEAVERLLTDEAARKEQVEASAKAVAMLRDGDIMPSDRAAEVTLKVARRSIGAREEG